MLSFLKYLVVERLLLLAVLAIMLISGFGGVFLSEIIVDWFGLDEDAGMYVKLAFFTVIFVAIGWLYDKYREWRFFRD